MRTLLCYCFFFLLLALMSCRQEEDTPPISPVPVIAFKGLTKHTSWTPARPMAGYVGDSLNLSIDYQDGDGDLGYSTQELTDIINQYGPNGVDRKRVYNYYLELEKKVKGVFKPVLFSTPDFNFWAIFPRIEMLNAGYLPSLNPFRARMYSPHHGEIMYRFIIEPPIDNSPDYVQIGDTLRGRVQIADRARNVSNTIETTEFIFMK